VPPFLGSGCAGCCWHEIEQFIDGLVDLLCPGGRTLNDCWLLSERSWVQTQGLQTLTSAYSISL